MIPGWVVSDAVRVHEVPTVMATPVKFTTAELAAAGVEPVSVHEEVIAMVSVALESVAGLLLASSTVT